MPPTLQEILKAFATVAPESWANHFQEEPTIRLDPNGAFVVVKYVIAGPTKVTSVSQRIPIVGSANAVADRILATIQADVKHYLA